MSSRKGNVRSWGGGALALIAALLGVTALGPGVAVAATGSISGSVTDASTAKPVEGILVCAWQLPDEEEFGCEETAADGTYAIGGLAAGKYGVEFWPAGSGYLLQFYDGRSSWFEADPVTVGTGSVIGIDAAMEPGGRIEGTVTAAGSGKPVGEVEVCAWRVDGEEGGGRCTLTEFDGTYELAGLEGGEYKVEFWTGYLEANLATQFYDHEYEWEEADVIAVAAGEIDSGIDAKLDAGAEISGTVAAAASGLPLDERVVCSVRAVSGSLWSCAETAPNGHYVLSGLAPGQYKVGFSIEFKEFFGEEIFEGENDGYLTQFWNQQPTLAAANTMALSIGGSLAGIDARLIAAGGGTAQAPVQLAVPPARPAAAAVRRPKRCKHGFRRKKIRGKVRCVKVHRHKRRHHH